MSINLHLPSLMVGLAVAAAAIVGITAAIRRARRSQSQLNVSVERLAQQQAQLVQLREEGRAQQDFLRNVIDTVPGFVCVKELQGRFALANRGLADAYGTTCDGIVGKSDHDFNDDADQIAGFIEDDRQVIVNRVVKRIPAEPFTTRAGEERWLQTTKVPLVERDGSCTRLLAVAMDITEQRRLEQELVQAQKLHAIGQLAGGVAHDFNNVLTGIIGAADMIERALPLQDVELREHCAVIERAAEHAARLTRELLAFARKAPLVMTEIDVHEVLLHVVQLLRRTIDPRITVVTNFSPDPEAVRGDPMHLQNAVLNIAVNARDAMPDGGTLTISTARVDLNEHDCREGGWDLQPGPHVELTITDTGRGMDLPTRTRIFEPFFTTKAAGRGTGLGLSAVYGTVRSHQGKICVDSEPGHGSSFKLYLPAVKASPCGRDRTCTAELEPGSGRVLLVDDEPIVRRVVGRTLVSLGYQVDEADGGEAALRSYAERAFDLVILDVIMPGLNGAAVFRRLRELNPQVRVLLASGFSQEGEVQALLAEGACGFLQKPFREPELARAVRRALEDPIAPGSARNQFGTVA